MRCSTCVNCSTWVMRYNTWTIKRSTGLWDITLGISISALGLWDVALGFDPRLNRGYSTTAPPCHTQHCNRLSFPSRPGPQNYQHRLLQWLYVLLPTLKGTLKNTPGTLKVFNSYHCYNCSLILDEQDAKCKSVDGLKAHSITICPCYQIGLIPFSSQLQLYKAHRSTV